MLLLLSRSPVVRIEKLYITMSKSYSERSGWPDKDNPSNTNSNMISTDDSDLPDESASLWNSSPSSNIIFPPGILHMVAGTAYRYMYKNKNKRNKRKYNNYNDRHKQYRDRNATDESASLWDPLPSSNELNFSHGVL